MYVLFEDVGKLLAGRMLSEAGASAQVELESGKRVKVKAVNVLLRFDKPAPAALLAQAQELAAAIEADIVWEFAPEGEFGFADLARDYFSASASVEEQVGMLLRLRESPHYFRRAGKGHFKKMPADIVQQALAAIEKKKRIQQEIDAWAAALAEGRCPQPIAEQLYKILFRPDKNTPEYKAVVQAARSTQTAPLELLRKAGAIASPYQFHWKRFLLDFFPRGVGFPPLAVPAIAEELPLAPVQAYSIDDSHTTEIDDALSLQGLGTGTVTLGIHIAAPGLAIHVEDAPGSVARQRLSTVYMPGYKITMLPDDIVRACTLREGCVCAAVSLYVRYDEATLTPQQSVTRLERVPVLANLRHDQLDHIVTQDWLEDAGRAMPDDAPAALAQARPMLAFLWKLAQTLKQRREVVRGKPEAFNRPDYTFRLLEHDPKQAPVGNERVEITMRQRGAPLDLIVSEAMIVANSTWGHWMHTLGVPAIYRSQYSMAPGVKVRMGTKALPHAGLGVECYAWSTSPLRRYVDLVNQWQIIACARHGATAALAAPFKPKDAHLFAIISAFDAAYTGYNAYQAGMERFWTLQYVRQNGVTELTASIIKDMQNGGNVVLARADTLPLVINVTGGQNLPRGAHVRLRLDDIDDIALNVNATLLERLDDAQALAAEDEQDADDSEDLSNAGSIVIAVNVADGDNDSAPPVETSSDNQAP